MTNSTYGTMYYVDNMAQAVSYYKKSIGLTAGYESDDWTEFNIGTHRLCLHAKRAGETYTPNGVLIMSQDGVKSLYDKMKGDGLNVFGLHQIHPEAWSFHFKDNSNNELSFYGKP